MLWKFEKIPENLREFWRNWNEMRTNFKYYFEMEGHLTHFQPFQRLNFRGNKSGKLWNFIWTILTNFPDEIESYFHYISFLHKEVVQQFHPEA
jgi:hypothetical protein